MFAWRKKPEGFEWHKYIRTTIKVGARRGASACMTRGAPPASS